MKIITIVENDPITGVRYGTMEMVPETTKIAQNKKQEKRAAVQAAANQNKMLKELRIHRSRGKLK